VVRRCRLRAALCSCDPITDALGLIPAVDLAVTYGVSMDGHQVAVTAVTLRPRRDHQRPRISPKRWLPCHSGWDPTVVHVVAEMTLSATYRPTVSALRAGGIPKAGTPMLGFFDADANQFPAV